MQQKPLDQNLFIKRKHIHQFCDRLQILAKKDSVEFDFQGFCEGITKILFQKKELKNFSYSETQHLNLRILQGEKTGASYTKDFSLQGIEDCYRQALDSLKFSDKKERGDLSFNQIYKNFSAFYDEEFKNIPIESKIKKAKEMNSACWSFDKKAQPIYSSLIDGGSYNFFANSQGQNGFYKTNQVYAYCFSLAVDGQNRAQGLSECNGKNYKSIDFKKVGLEAASKALKKLNYSIPQTGPLPVVFQAGPAVAPLLLRLADLMSGQRVFENLSILKSALKGNVFSKNFSLYDDPLALWGARSMPFDGEGFAVEKTPLVLKGTLENYLTNSFYAKALKSSHTKKAVWRKAELSVSPTNLVLPEGQSSFKELVGEFPKVLVVDWLKGFAGYNETSGDFSIESEGFLWEKGEARPLCQFTVSGNIKKVFSNILKIGNDSQIYNGIVKAPSILIENLMIAGK